MNTHPLGPVGNLFQLAAIISSGVLGFRSHSIMMSALIGGVLFAIGYIFVRLPQVIGMYRRDGPKVILALLYLVIGNSVLAAIFYGMGWLLSWAFR